MKKKNIIRIIISIISFVLVCLFIFVSCDPNSNLLRAAGDGNLKEAQKAIEKGANNLEFALAHASSCYANRNQIILLLYECGAKVHTIGPFSATPLMCAVRNKNIEHVKLLLSLGADSTINIQEPLNGYSALMWAVSNYESNIGLEIIKLLIVKNANLHLKDKKGKTALLIAENLKINEIINYFNNI